MKDTDEVIEDKNKLNKSKKSKDMKKKRNKNYYTRKLTAAKYTILGKEINEGLLFKAFMYITFISTSYIYLDPIFKMIANMFMSPEDLLNPTITWIPTAAYLGNLARAWDILHYPQAFTISLIVALSAAIFHCISCGFAGYAFAKLEFPFKKFAFVLLLVAFIVPQQVIVLPTIIAYTNLGLNNSIITLIIPSVLGFGVKGALFVIIFRQFFLTQPKELEEAARIDGASAIKFYVKIMLPLARPAILVVFLFSFVWTWNDTYLPRMFLSPDSSLLPLASEMLNMNNVINNMLAEGQIAAHAAEAVKMAASFLAILPPLLFFMIFQKHFVESVERTGLVE